ncbi:MAG: hypothetical protein JWL76_1068 [Thermoleophilia bacterium]|nr:hypothetical protein [Thermoleophilia bacterium]
MTGTARHRAERASAIVGAIALMVLGALLVTAILAMLDRSDERNRSRTQRAASVAVVDHALASYEYALESNITDETADFLLNEAAMTKLAQFRPGMQPVSNATFGTDFKAKGLDVTTMPNPSTRWSMRVDQADGTTGWWQTIAVLPPRGNSPNLVLYLRTWNATGDQNSQVVGDARLVRAELRPGRFSDYQMLVDGPIILGYGLTINGRIHTNGYPDAYLVDMLVDAGKPMKLYTGADRPHCQGGAGFSTAVGGIENKGGCIVDSGPTPRYLEKTGERYDLLRGSNHLTMLSKLCGTRVRCGTGTGPWTVTLSGSSMTATSPNGSLGTVSAVGGAVVYLTGNVRLSGMLNGGQLTIGVGNQGGSFNVNGSASIDLVGNGMIGANTSTDAILGLVVEGDIIPRIDEGYCPAGLNAAIVSASGTLGVPPQYRVPAPPVGAVPLCGTFSFTGSLGAHYMSLMRINWGVAEVGYPSRLYKFDPRLLTTAPPMFPTTGPWQTSTWKDADPRCLSAANIDDAECG